MATRHRYAVCFLAPPLPERLSGQRTSLRRGQTAEDSVDSALALWVGEGVAVLPKSCSLEQPFDDDQTAPRRADGVSE